LPDYERGRAPVNAFRAQPTGAPGLSRDRPPRTRRTEPPPHRGLGIIPDMDWTQLLKELTDMAEVRNNRRTAALCSTGTM
jgi:hypothetical protein